MQPGQQQRAPAKLTRTLRITGVRADGHHLLDAEIVSIDLADTLTFWPGEGLEVVDLVEGGLAGVAPVPEGEVNLVARALRAVGRRARVRLEKHIPACAGLGGGSADAAAVLRWAGVEDPGVAASLGADVAFCVAGGRARVGGVGERVEPMPFEERSFLLLTPPVAVSTALAYRAWDELGGPAADGPNDLEPAALALSPVLARWRDRLGEVTGRTPVLAGSGSTWFVEWDGGGGGSAGSGGSVAGMPEGVDGLEVEGVRAPLRLVRAVRG